MRDTTSSRGVELVRAKNGEVAHIRLNSDLLCSPNSHTSIVEVLDGDDYPSGGLCDNCKRFGEVTGLVEVPTANA